VFLVVEDGIPVMYYDMVVMDLYSDLEKYLNRLFNK
jgi:hypothetical protein